MPESDNAMSRHREMKEYHVLASLGLFLFALAVRALPWLTTVRQGGIVPFGNDAFYHLRRIAFSVVHFPAVLRFDPYIHFPEGSRPIWTDLFDWAVAAAVRPFVGTVDPTAADGLHAIERLAIWVPPLLGAATVVTLYRLALRHFGRNEATLAALVLAVLPAHAHYSRVGFVDHHAAVALAAVLVLAGSMGWLRSLSSLPTVRQGLRSDLLLAASFAFALLLWPGSLLHVAVAATGLVIWVASTVDREPAVVRALHLAIVFLVSCLAMLPLCLGQSWPQWSPFSPLVLSRFQPWLLGSAALAVFAALAVWHRTSLGRRRSRRIMVLALIGIGTMSLGLLLPGLPEGLAEAARWLLRKEAFQAQVVESEPLFVFASRPTILFAVTRLSPLVLVFPVIVVAALVKFRRRAGAAPVLLATGYAVGLGLAALLQKRFVNSFAVPFALLTAWGLCAAYCQLAARLPRPRRQWALAAGAAVLWVTLWPAVELQSQHVVNHLRWLRGEPLALSRYRLRQARQIEVAMWLREHTPPTSGWLSAVAEPEYGILAPWPLGHVIEYYGRRPAVIDGFGDDIGGQNMKLAAQYFRKDEAAAGEILDRLRVRYVVVGPGIEEMAGDTRPGAMAAALLAWSQPGSPALRRHRLVFESGPIRRSGPPLYRIFEVTASSEVLGDPAPIR